MSSMPRLLFFAGLLAIPLCLPMLPPGLAAAPDPSTAVRPAPEFTRSDAPGWINSTPLTLADLRGKVVLLDVWTFGCWNCTRSIPWLKTLEQRLSPRGLKIIGIHSPEFDHEKNTEAVKSKVREFGLGFPVMLDEDFRYWRALGNRYWPSFYLVDKAGRIRAAMYGETHPGTSQARAMEDWIERLLAE